MHAARVILLSKKSNKNKWLTSFSPITENVKKWTGEISFLFFWAQHVN